MAINFYENLLYTRETMATIAHRICNVSSLHASVLADNFCTIAVMEQFLSAGNPPRIRINANIVSVTVVKIGDIFLFLEIIKGSN